MDTWKCTRPLPSAFAHAWRSGVAYNVYCMNARGVGTRHHVVGLSTGIDNICGRTTEATTNQRFEVCLSSFGRTEGPDGQTSLCECDRRCHFFELPLATAQTCHVWQKLFPTLAVVEFLSNNTFTERLTGDEA